MGEIIFDDEISCGDEIRLDGGMVDLISSASADFIRGYTDFIVSNANDFIKTNAFRTKVLGD